ncbi:hypothetical protein [Rheinheimera sp.]|uniref:hypothetical protein n=1 Tax=Rheinheimera sp. TaxID=1869214 RepID=UPI004048E9CE
MVFVFLLGKTGSFYIKMLPKKEQLPSFLDMYISCFGYWQKRHKLAAEFFGVSEQTCKRWCDTNNPPLMAQRYLAVHYRGYLPLIGGWSHFSIDSKGVLHTPHGSCSAGDIAMIWRYKWSAEQSARQLKSVRDKLTDVTSGTKYKMLLHTADYLNRLVQEFSSME